jgi:hypothetical protein
MREPGAAGGALGHLGESALARGNAAEVAAIFRARLAMSERADATAEAIGGIGFLDPHIAVAARDGVGREPLADAWRPPPRHVRQTVLRRLA